MNNKLNEAFSPSMPSWMKEKLKNNGSLLNRYLINNDINPESAIFHEYPVPTSPRDPIKNDPNKIVFYDLLISKRNQNDHAIFVWGISNNDVFYNPIDDKLYYMKEASWTKIFQACLHVCYIDKASGKSFGVKDKILQRGRNQSSVEQKIRDAQQTKRSFDIEDKWDSISDSRMNDLKSIRVPTDVQDLIRNRYRDYQRKYNFDKSGYLKDPDLLKRLKDKHPDYQLKHIQKDMPNIYQELIQYQIAISDMFLSMDFIQDKDALSTTILETYQLAAENYRYAYQELSRDRWVDYDAANRYIREAKVQLNKLSTMLQKDTDTSVVDWDSDDMYIDDED